MSPSALKPFGIKRVCIVWNISRSTIHRHKVLALHGATPKKKRGPKTCLADAQVLEEIKIVLRNSPFVGEGLAGSWQGRRACFAHLGAFSAQAGLWRENNVLAPMRCRSSPGPRVHDGTIVTARPDEMWAIDGTACMTDQGSATVFVVIDHCTGEFLGARATRRGTRHEAIDTLRQAIRATRGTFDRDVAAGVALRHDHGSQFISYAFQDELRFVGIRSSPSFVRSRPTRVKGKRLCRTIHSNTQGAIALAHTIRNRRRTRCCASRLCASIQQSLDPRASCIQNACAAPTQFPRGGGRDLHTNLCQQWDPVHSSFEQGGSCFTKEKPGEWLLCHFVGFEYRLISVTSQFSVRRHL
jgi:putative transposase